MNIIISTHSVDKFVSRVCGVDDEEYSDKLSKMARDHIMKSIEEPDWIKEDREGEPPIYIRGRAAVVLDEEKAHGDAAVVTTVYHSSTFEDHGPEEQKARLV